jgi:hypothetical protein
VDEALKKTFELGKGMAEEGVKFGALRFATRSTPVAVGITVFLGDLDKNNKFSASERFDNEIVKVVNTVRPNSVRGWGPGATTEMWFEDAEAEKLWKQARKQAVDMLKGQMAWKMRGIGEVDGYSGSKKTKFELSDDDAKILGINIQWLQEKYQDGVTFGKRFKDQQLQQARAKGADDGKKGNPENPQQLEDWDVVRKMLKKIEQASGDEDLDVVVRNQFYNKYKEGYAEGRKWQSTTGLEKLVFAPPSLSMGAFTKRKLKVTMLAKDGTSIDITGKVKPRPKSDIVSVIGYSDLHGIEFLAQSEGTTQIEVDYITSSGSVSGKVPVTVAPLKKVWLVTDDPTMKIGPNQFGGTLDTSKEFRVVPGGGDHSSELPAFWFDWKSDAIDTVSIDGLKGVATFRKLGKANLTVTYKKNPKVTETIEIEVKPKFSQFGGVQVIKARR